MIVIVTENIAGMTEIARAGMMLLHRNRSRENLSGMEEVCECRIVVGMRRLGVLVMPVVMAKVMERAEGGTRLLAPYGSRRNSRI
jgi:hypothetical protein